MYACFRTKPLINQPIIGNLSAYKIDIQRGFNTCGVDFSGPISIKCSVGRNAPMSKGYICLFICFVSIAVHIELVSDLITNTFIIYSSSSAVFRRGVCKTIFSDNAINFVGVSRQLKEITDLFSSKKHLRKINKCFRN